MDIQGNAPKWELPRKFRSRAPPTQLEGGFREFYTANPTSSAPLNRRHFDELRAVALEEKRQKALVELKPLEPHQTGKRKHFPPILNEDRSKTTRAHPTQPQSGYDDKFLIGQGQPKTANGTRAADKRSGHSTLNDILTRKALVDDLRNSLPATKPGDKPYQHVEHSTGYHSQQSDAFQHCSYLKALETQEIFERNRDVSQPKRVPYVQKLRQSKIAVDQLDVTKLPKDLLRAQK